MANRWMQVAMKVTMVCFFAAYLAIIGIPPFSGFWSKDEILGAAFVSNPVLFLLALATVFMTAF